MCRGDVGVVSFLGLECMYPNLSKTTTTTTMTESPGSRAKPQSHSRYRLAFFQRCGKHYIELLTARSVKVFILQR